MNRLMRHTVLGSIGMALTALLIGCTTVAPPTPVESQWGSFTAADGAAISYRFWAGPASPRAVVQIVHGAAEHSGRYDRFAKALVANGYAVYATDHRGHGRPPGLGNAEASTASPSRTSGSSSSKTCAWTQTRLRSETSSITSPWVTY